MSDVPSRDPATHGTALATQDRPQASDPAGAVMQEAQPQPLNPRIAAAAMCFFISLGLISVMFLLPAKYVVIQAGPAVNTLGDLHGSPVVSISGTKTYPTGQGTLDLTTVRLDGAPGDRVSFADVIGGWLSDDIEVVPLEKMFDPNTNEQDSDRENQAKMDISQELAKVVALRILGYKVPEKVKIATFSEGIVSEQARNLLRENDIIESINGVPLTGSVDLSDQLQKVPPGRDVTLRIQRDGRALQAVVPTVAKTVKTTMGERQITVIGVVITPEFTFPFPIDFKVEEIGGPSAGAMLSLAIIDKLTPGELTGGKKIAGTGTIDPEGNVGPIGGIQQKLIGARQAGAEFFLAPADNCDEVVGHIPTGLSVVRIENVTQAKQAVEKIAAHGDDPSLPRCTAAQ